MLERVEHSNGLVSYQSPRLRALDLPHGFTTRVGGISAPPYDSLNLASLVKGPDSDANTHIAENFRRLRAALGLERVPRVSVRQVHGNTVWIETQQHVHPKLAPAADAIVTDRAKRMLTIRTADCVPILLASATQPRVIAAVHAGWRGIVAGIVEQTIQTMRTRYNIDADDLVAAVGPCISAAHYEVGTEVADAFREAALDAAIMQHADQPKPHIDLAEAVVLQLQRAGVPEAHIDRGELCTYGDAEEFFSHRRDAGITGRLAAVIAIR